MPVTALRLTVTTLLLLTALILACGDDAQPTATPTATPIASVTTTATATTTPTPVPEPPISAAIDSLASWLGPVADPASIEVASTEEITWSNGCLDIARVDMMCTEALVPGYRIMLSLGDATYEVRTDASGQNTAWAPQIQILVRFVEVGPNLATFRTDDGNEFPTQLVPGTSFGVDLATLDQGTPVGIAIADAPQSGAPLLVWVDPF